MMTQKDYILEVLNISNDDREGLKFKSALFDQDHEAYYLSFDNMSS